MEPKRKINRLTEYDYAQSGAYFITICTHGYSMPSVSPH